MEEIRSKETVKERELRLRFLRFGRGPGITLTPPRQAPPPARALPSFGNATKLHARDHIDKRIIEIVPKADGREDDQRPRSKCPREILRDAMKFPRCRLLDLAADAAALPAMSRFAWAQG